MMKHPNRVYMTQQDHSIISSLLSRLPGTELSAIERLAYELDRAEVFPSAQAIPGDVVVMHSWVHYINLNNGHRRQVQIVYPHEVDISQDRVSILSAVGSALIGLREQDEIEWRMPNDEVNTLRVEKVTRALP